MSESFEYSYSAERQREIDAIRRKYLPRDEGEDKLARLRALDGSLGKKALVAALTLGIAGALAFGTGMCCFLVWSLWVPGALLCAAGAAAMLAAPGLYRALVEKRRQEIAPEILRLTEELSRR